jgi:hypothetical protein
VRICSEGMLASGGRKASRGNMKMAAIIVCPGPNRVGEATWKSYYTRETRLMIVFKLQLYIHRYLKPKMGYRIQGVVSVPF